MIAIIDYGMGNLRSVQKALEHVGAKAFIAESKDDILNAQKVVLPGVGAIKPAMERLQELSLIDTIQHVIKSRKSFLGICLGYQLLFESSNEGGQVKGLGILKGTVERFQDLKVPHMGWNQLSIKPSPLLRNIDTSSEVYFCHSYFVKPEDSSTVTSTTNYGKDFASSVQQDNVFGVQFHPEKSQATGLTILKNFVDFK